MNSNSIAEDPLKSVPKSSGIFLREKYQTNVLILVLTILFVSSVSLALIIGDIGFQGDDWWEFSWPYWFSFPQSTLECVKQYSRPVEGLYYVLLYESFGLNRFFYTLTSLLLLAGSSALLVRCLQNAFPQRISLSVVSGFLPFSLHQFRISYTCGILITRVWPTCFSGFRCMVSKDGR